VSEAWYESLTVHAFVALRIKSNEFIEETDQIHDRFSFEQQITSAGHVTLVNWGERGQTRDNVGKLGKRREIRDNGGKLGTTEGN